MRENDLSQLILGDKLKDITTQDHKVVTQWYLPNSENLYKGSFCVNNPNMMYIREFGEFPLMSIEVHAWMIARIVTNQMALPSKKEMKGDGLRSVLECLQHPTMRYFMDWKYQNAIDDAIEKDEDLEDACEELWEESIESHVLLECRYLGEIMNRYRYPVSHLCPDGKTFSEYHKAIMVADDADSRWSLSELTYNTAHEKDGWRSFRDTPSIEDSISYFTGIRAKMLPKPWFELDGTEKLW